ncbi:MAG: HisA/HisF-related TIM barrel protein [Nitrososphaerales archaeon]
MKVIPVIDILDGKVVHAVAGERSRYQPIKSAVVNTHDPVEVARAFKERLKRDTIYVADLDAIIGLGENIDLVKRIKHSLSLTVMLDGGVSSFAEANRIIQQGFDYLVLGIETLQRLDELKQMIKSPFAERVITSLDVKAQKTLSECEELRGLDPIDAANILYQIGVKKLILLELDRVGTLKGPNFKLLEELCSTPFKEVLVGGGVRNKQDLLKLKELNINGVLVASALHNGALKLEDLLDVED